MISERVHIAKLFFLSLGFIISAVAFSQDSTKKMVFTDSAVTVRPADSLAKVAPPVAHENRVDSIMRHHPPGAAAFRSAVIPGWGQFYNKKYWKIPIVWGALGISGSVFVYNLTTYRDVRFAYKAKYNAALPRRDPVTGATLPPDSTDYFKIRKDLINIDANALRSYRDEFRRNIDYSALIFIVLWGLNVVDATVDAHLKAFDVSPDLTLQLKIGPSQMARTNGVSLVLAFK